LNKPEKETKSIAIAGQGVGAHMLLVHKPIGKELL
jgi:hypothetical protein